MASVNDVTQDRLVSKHNTNKFRDGWERIFEKEKNKDENVESPPRDVNEKKDV